MELTWWGTAGYKIKTENQTFLIDPYLSRNKMARPHQDLTPSEISAADRIFISHGHFDHICDVPAIAEKTGATVHCCPVAADTLKKNGLKEKRIQLVTENETTVDFNGHRARSFFSQHVKFDRWLLIKTLTRINLRIPRYLPLMRDYPAGQVLSWRFEIDGQTIQHFGSAGSTPAELERLGRQSIDFLLVPLQGHTRICDIALNYVKSLNPRVVIPHHQDDFFPPISTYVDIIPFVKAVMKTCPNTEVRIMRINDTIAL